MDSDALPATAEVVVVREAKDCTARRGLESFPLQPVGHVIVIGLADATAALVGAELSEASAELLVESFRRDFGGLEHEDPSIIAEA